VLPQYAHDWPAEQQVVPLQQSLPPHVLQYVLFPLLQVHVPPHSHPLPGDPPLMLPQPPHALQLGEHQSSFLSAAHAQEPQQPPLGDGGVQALWSVNFRPPQPPQALREDAPEQVVASVPLQA
jgi:hypothetical protein